MADSSRILGYGTCTVGTASTNLTVIYRRVFQIDSIAELLLEGGQQAVRYRGPDPDTASMSNARST